jgi:pimeloyl-ACP methyl ester carboxylesterase
MTIRALLIAGLLVSAETGPIDYRDQAAWLCRPGRIDACTVDLTTTVIGAGGTLTREASHADPNPAIDCFYVYPTVSLEPTPNSGVTPGDAEQNAVRLQLARFASVCHVFAPMYRQVTVAALNRIFGPTDSRSPVDPNRFRAIAYGDVTNAWHDYLLHDNRAHGVVLIGHSQGATILTQLIQREIDGTPMQARLVSAILLGSGIAVPRDGDVGGTFSHVPLCRSATEIGCVIAYSSFGASAPPPTDTMFGIVSGAGMVAACTNPAALRGGSGELSSYFSTDGRTVFGAPTRQAWVTPNRPIDTPWVSLPGLLSARCASSSNASEFLEITVHADASRARTSEIGGELRVAGRPLESWGLHLLDVNIALGNLVQIVREQSRTYARRLGRSPHA